MKAQIVYNLSTWEKSLVLFLCASMGNASALERLVKSLAVQPILALFI